MIKLALLEKFGGLSVNFESSGGYVELGIGLLDEWSDIVSFDDDMIAIFAKHFVDKRRAGVDF